MSNEKRAFFRLDVIVPLFLEPMDAEQHCLHVSKQALLSVTESQQIKQENHALATLLADKRHVSSGSAKVFAELDQKLHFMEWVLDGIMAGELHHEEAEFREKLAQIRSLTRPQTRTGADTHSSKVLPLIQALYDRLDHYNNELAEVVEGSVHGKVFMYKKASLPIFSDKKFLTGLDLVANKGNWLAQVLRLLIRKLNHYERLLIKLKKAYAKLSDKRLWPAQKVNLGAGGFAMQTSEDYAMGQQFCVLFDLDDEYVFAQARCVYQQQTSAQGLKRTAFEFYDMSSEDEAHIVRFLMQQELQTQHPDTSS